MTATVAVDVDLAVLVPERLLMATADVLPEWLRQETMGSPKLFSYQADRKEQGIWEFRAGRGYFELEHHPVARTGQHDAIELAVRVIDGAVYAGVRTAGSIDWNSGAFMVIAAIDARMGNLLSAGLLAQLSAQAAGKGDGLKTVHARNTRLLAVYLQECAA